MIPAQRLFKLLKYENFFGWYANHLEWLFTYIYICNVYTYINRQETLLFLSPMLFSYVCFVLCCFSLVVVVVVVVVDKVNKTLWYKTVHDNSFVRTICIKQMPTTHQNHSIQFNSKANEWKKTPDYLINTLSYSIHII